MYGFQNLASQQQQRFWAYTSANGGAYYTWIKPPGISFVHILCIGAGAGGSSGVAWATGTARVGGGAGGSGGMNNVFLPAYLVPDTLYISVTAGGVGGASTTSGTVYNSGAANPSSTYVGFYPVQAAAYSLCTANPGGAPSNNVGGNPGSTANSAFFPNSQVGLRTYNGGQGGGSGQSTIQPTAITATYRTTGGGGGAGTSAANAVFSGSLINPVNALNAITSDPGASGGFLNDLISMIATGGSGGGSSITNNGGNGGRGGFGSGGGGGAVGNTNSGAGGNGGDGLVIITCG